MRFVQRFAGSSASNRVVLLVTLVGLFMTLTRANDTTTCINIRESDVFAQDSCCVREGHPCDDNGFCLGVAIAHFGKDDPEAACCGAYPSCGQIKSLLKTLKQIRNCNIFAFVFSFLVLTVFAIKLTPSIRSTHDRADIETIVLVLEAIDLLLEIIVVGIALRRSAGDSLNQWIDADCFTDDSTDATSTFIDIQGSAQLSVYAAIAGIEAVLDIVLIVVKLLDIRDVRNKPDEAFEPFSAAPPPLLAIGALMEVLEFVIAMAGLIVVVSNYNSVVGVFDKMALDPNTDPNVTACVASCCVTAAFATTGAPSLNPITLFPTIHPSLNPTTIFPTTAVPSTTPSLNQITSFPTIHPSLNPTTMLPATAVPTTATPTKAPETFYPSWTPTGIPSTESPTTIPTYTNLERVSEISLFVNSVSFALTPLRFPVFEGNATAEELALEWLIVNDPAQLIKNASYNQRRVRTRYALAVVWFGWLDSQSQTQNLSSSWLTATDECTWKGVACENGEVIEVSATSELILRGSISPDFALLRGISAINWISTGLTGSLPQSLGSMTALTSISIVLPGSSVSGERSEFGGSIPSFLGTLESLKSIDLEGNAFTGRIPSSIGKLSTLETLRLGRNRLTGSLPTQLGALQSISDLSVAGNLLSGTIPKSIGGLSYLTNLDFSDTQLNGTIPSDFVKLKVINLHAYFQATNLTGTMPLCLLGTLIPSLFADCEEVACPCCTQCCDTTNHYCAPTRQPTVPPPSRRPTPRPTPRPPPPPVNCGGYRPFGRCWTNICVTCNECSRDSDCLSWSSCQRFTGDCSDFSDCSSGGVVGRSYCSSLFSF